MPAGLGWDEGSFLAWSGPPSKCVLSGLFWGVREKVLLFGVPSSPHKDTSSAGHRLAVSLNLSLLVKLGSPHGELEGPTPLQRSRCAGKGCRGDAQGGAHSDQG